MAYLTRDELFTHLYDEVISEINRDTDIIPYATLNNFPVTGDPAKRYKALDTSKYYKWITNAYVETQYEDRPSEAIAAAISEASGYLTPDDMATEYAKSGDDRNPILLLYLKDIAVWHFCTISNPQVDLEFREKRYNTALKQLQKIQEGKWNPKLPTFSVESPNQLENFFKFGSNTKRNDYFN